MILAAILGIQLMRKVIGIKALAEANAVSLSRDLETMFQRLIDSSAGRKSADPKRSTPGEFAIVPRHP
jgi:hypothetical protein